MKDMRCYTETTRRTCLATLGLAAATSVAANTTGWKIVGARGEAETASLRLRRDEIRVASLQPEPSVSRDLKSARDHALNSVIRRVEVVQASTQGLCDLFHVTSLLPSALLLLSPSEAQKVALRIDGEGFRKLGRVSARYRCYLTMHGLFQDPASHGQVRYGGVALGPQGAVIGQRWEDRATANRRGISIDSNPMTPLSLNSAANRSALIHTDIGNLALLADPRTSHGRAAGALSNAEILLVADRHRFDERAHDRAEGAAPFMLGSEPAPLAAGALLGEMGYAGSSSVGIDPSGHRLPANSIAQADAMLFRLSIGALRRGRAA